MMGTGSAIGMCLASGVALVRRGAWACALPLALVVLITPGGASAAAAGSCPNEKVRGESSLIPGTATHYSQELSECRAYEMVTPLEKGGHDADIGGESGAIVLPLWVAPSGEALIWHAEGAFAGAGNFLTSSDPENPYRSQRTGSGWGTSFFAPPRSVVNVPFFNGFLGDASPDLSSAHAACGLQPDGAGENEFQSIVCAGQQADGSWLSSPRYTSPSDLKLGHFTSIYLGMGWTSPTPRFFVAPNEALLPEDVVTPHGTNQSTGSIYEIAGLGSSATLRLVNLDNQGHVLLASGNEGAAAPSLGSFTLTTDDTDGSQERAISQSGETTFFTATPNPVRPEEQTLALYARVPCKFAALPCDTKSDGQVVEGRQTVNVSDPDAAEGCEKCNPEANTPEMKGSVEESAIYQGASADGSKVFFTTTHALLGGSDETLKLYEYDFNGEEGHKVVELSKTTATEQAEVQGVVAVSPDGSHVYFVARGALPDTEPNTTIDANGNVVHESPVAGESNLYLYDADAEAEGKKPLELVAAGNGELDKLAKPPETRDVQTTPDGRFLVFSASEALAGDLDTGGCPSKCPKAVYRYDAKTGELTWVSHSALEADGTTFKDEASQASYGGEKNPAIVGGCFSPCAGWSGAVAAREDVGRTISDDGQYIIFMTAQKLQEGDHGQSAEVYVWHEGTVHMISDGHDPQGIGNESAGNPEGEPPVAAMSASGSDIFFTTRTGLVPRDTDDLRDVYDARIDGGFTETVPPSCPPEAAGGCQGSASPPPSPTAAPTTFSAPGGNLAPPLESSLAFKTTSKPPPPTRAQKLASALKTCRKQHKRKPRVACEGQARKKYGAKKKAK